MKTETEAQAEIAQIIWDSPTRLGKALGYDKLKQIHSQWVKYIFDSDGDTKVLLAHRNSYKTTSVVVGIIRHLFFNPEATILIMRKSFTDAQKILQEVAQHYERDYLRQVYRLFNVEEPRGKWTQNAISLSTKTSVTKEANLECLGIDSSLTGAHYDLVLLDDIITIDDRLSKVVRERTKIRLQEMINIPKRPDGRIRVTGTPWHPDDGYKQLPPALVHSIYTIPQPVLQPHEIENIRSRMTPSLFSANYELRHIADEDKFFDQPKFGFPSKFDRVLAFLDPAYSGRHYTALSVVGYFQNFLYATGKVWRESVTDCAGDIVEFCNKIGCRELHIEKNGDKGLSIRFFRDKYPGRCRYIEHSESTNKHQRIVGYIKPVWEEIHFDPNCQADWLNQILDYQERLEPDDAPDSLAGALSKITNKSESLYMLGNLG